VASRRVRPCSTSVDLINQNHRIAHNSVGLTRRFGPLSP
jgi:hypothetical protein